MTKVCFFTEEWLERARHTADNLLIAKLMMDYGKPLNPDLNFYVGNGKNESFFLEALNEVFIVKANLEEEEETDLLVTNSEIQRWVQLAEKVQNTNLYEAFRMVQKGIESTLNSNEFKFDGKMEGTFTGNGLEIKILGSNYYLLYSEFLEVILEFAVDLKKQLPIWEDMYHEQTERSHRNTDLAS